ncbi:MAG: TetR/AcrR family transcriptional regulator [Novosphingobium sp.]
MEAKILPRSLRSQDGSPTDARQVRSRKALTGALLVLLEAMPFDQVTIREITARAGTGYATFFRHYPDKEALLGDVASQEIASLLAMVIPMLGPDGSGKTTSALCRHVGVHRKLWFALLTGGAAGILRAEFIRQARDLVGNMDQPESWLPSDLAVVYGTGSTIDLLAWWLAHDEAYSADEIAAILDRLIIAPLLDGRTLPRSTAG